MHLCSAPPTRHASGTWPSPSTLMRLLDFVCPAWFPSLAVLPALLLQLSVLSLVFPHMAWLFCVPSPSYKLLRSPICLSCLRRSRWHAPPPPSPLLLLLRLLLPTTSDFLLCICDLQLVSCDLQLATCHALSAPYYLLRTAYCLRTHNCQVATAHATCLGPARGHRAMLCQIRHTYTSCQVKAV